MLTFVTTTDFAPGREAVLSSQLRVAVMRLGRRLRSERLESPHSLTHFAALGTVERHGPLNPRALAQHERVRPPSMTRIINHLEGAGLLRRAPHPTDGRQQLLSVTPAGRDLLEADRRRRDAWLSRQLETLSPSEIATLCDALPIFERLARS
jgi:DNA-binding MarR family transcriptional regulator